MNKFVGFSSLFLSSMLFGSFGIWIRFLNSEMSIYQQVVLRNAFCFIFIFVAILFSRQLFNANLKNVNKIHLVIYSLVIPVSVVFYNISILSTKIVLTTFGFYIGTILAGWVSGTLIYKEKLTLAKWVSLLFVLIGLCCFAYPFNSNSINLGFVIGIASGILDGIANAFRKNLGGKLSKFFLVMITSFGGVLVSGVLVWYFAQNFNYLTVMSVNAWFVGALFGAILVLVNYLLLVGFQNFDLSLGSIVLSMELMFALVFGMVIFKEYPTTREVVGGGFIILANIAPNINIKVNRWRSQFFQNGR